MARTGPRLTEPGDRRLGRQIFTIFVAATLAAMLLPGIAGALPTYYLRFHVQPGDGVSTYDLSPQPTVWITNWHGELQDVSGVDVSLALSTHVTDGTFGCDTNPVTTDHGVAAFTGCNVELDPGISSQVFTVTATASGFSPRLSWGFTVTGIPGDPTKLDFIDSPTSATSGVTWASADQPVVAVEDADGLVVTDDNTTDVTLSLFGSGGTYGTLSCSGGLTETAVDGYASFSGCRITLKPAAPSSYSFYLLASPDWSISPALAGPVAVNRYATYLDFTTQPGGGVAGLAWSQQPVVAIRNGVGSVVTSDSTTLVTLAASTNPTGGTLSCTSGLTVRAVNGYAAFTGCQISIGTSASTFRLTATSSPVLTPTVSDPFYVTAGGTYLAFSTQPGGGIEGVPWAQQPVVAIRNAAGVATGDSSTLVTLATGLNPTYGTLTCSSGTTVRAVNGYATFTGCRIDEGTYDHPFTLVATSSPVLTGATSGQFYVTPAVAQLTLGLKSGVGWVPPYYTTGGKYVPVGTWVALRVSTNPSLAGHWVSLYMATDQGGYWGGTHRHAYIWINSRGVGYIHLRVPWAETRYYFIRYPGDGIVSSGVSNGVWIRWR